MRQLNASFVFQQPGSVSGSKAEKRSDLSMSTLPVDESVEESWSGSPTNSKEHNIDFLEDEKADMTNSRLLALYLMKRFAWYNPRLNSTRPYQPDVVKEGGRFRSEDGYPRSHKVKETPSLQKAWAVSRRAGCSILIGCILHLC